MDRRLRYVCIPYDVVLSVFRERSSLRDGQTDIQIFQISNLPEDYEVVDVVADWQCRGFKFLVRHPSFDEVPEGWVIPSHDSLLAQVKCVRVQVVEEPEWGESPLKNAFRAYAVKEAIPKQAGNPLPMKRDPVLAALWDEQSSLPKPDHVTE